MSRRSLPLLLATTLLAAQGPTVAEPPLRAHLAFLADPLLEGRGTGQRGGELAVRYLETQLQVLGLRPVQGTSYRQPVDLVGIRTDPGRSILSFGGGGACATPAFGTDLVYGAGQPTANLRIEAPVVFVGYGIHAPEEGWDDYKGLDAQGKVLIMLGNEPGPTAAEPTRFGGQDLTYYGRWTYKFEEAARRGAAGVLLIHTPASASYGWSVVQHGWDTERFQLAGEAGTPLQGWLSEAEARKLLTQGGQNLAELTEQAQSRAFRPVALDLRAEGTLVSEVRTLRQANVAGLVPGTDPTLGREAVIYSAHWDHLGATRAPGASTPAIYPGAVDNASGCAALLAMAQAALQHPARRSQLFLFVCAEEQGLLGSRAYVAHPLWPLAQTVADLNLDSLNFVAPTRDIGLPFASRSTLGDLGAAVAKADHLLLAAPRPDTAGGYFRSDHYSFVQAGVPAVSIHGGHDYVGPDPAALKAEADA
ncbi:MAG TPA: M28 family peptidase, partial [Holophagaceae bacterium]